MPWWLAAIIFFFVGMAVERFIIDRKFIRETEAKMAELHEMTKRLGMTDDL